MTIDYMQEDFEERILSNFLNSDVNMNIALKETPLYHFYTKKYEKGQYKPFAIELVEANMYAPIMLFPYGTFKHPIYGELTFDDKFFTEMMENFNNNVRKVQPFIDERHDEGKALGWITYLYTDERGMWADVDWNEDGVNLIKRGSYKYISPWFGDYVNEETGKEYHNVLYGAALTNRPFLKVMPPVQLSENGKCQQEGECNIYYFEDLESQVSKKVNMNEIVKLIESFNTTKDKEIKNALKIKILDYLNFTKGGETQEMTTEEKKDQIQEKEEEIEEEVKVEEEPKEIKTEEKEIKEEEEKKIEKAEEEVKETEKIEIKEKEMEVVEEEIELEEVLLPYPNEHSCRLTNPDKYKRFARKNCAVKSDGKCIDFIFGIIEKDKSELQAMRYPIGIWTADVAETHCKGKNGTFEKAKEKTKTEEKPEEEIIKRTEEVIEEINDTITTDEAARTEKIIEEEKIEEKIVEKVVKETTDTIATDEIIEAEEIVEKEKETIKEEKVEEPKKEIVEEKKEEKLEEVDEKDRLLQEKDREIRRLKVEKLLDKKLVDNKILSESAKEIIRKILLAEDTKEIKLSEEESVNLLDAFDKLLDEVLVIDVSSKLEEDTDKPGSIDTQYKNAIRKIQKEHKCDYESAMDILQDENPELMKQALRE